MDAFVDALDLGELGFSTTPAPTGRPSYHPAMMLKIYLYGYMNRIQSSRRLERECQRNVELMWMTGRLAPDFVHDQLATGKKLRVLTVVDAFSRFSPIIDPRFSYRGEDVVQTLERTCKCVGYPKSIRVDQGSEFISHDLDLWAYQHNVVLDFSRPGKQTDNAFIESF